MSTWKAQIVTVILGLSAGLPMACGIAYTEKSDRRLFVAVSIPLLLLGFLGVGVRHAITHGISDSQQDKDERYED